MYTHSTTAVSKNTEPPNFRYADACAVCEMGVVGPYGQARCEKYQCSTEWHLICDDYERSSDE
jgi:hypothetical protein